MKYAIVSDIHGNLEALEAVLTEIPSSYTLVSLGDNIGYMANPNEIMDIIWKDAKFNVIGNHEKAAVDYFRGERHLNLNNLAYTAIAWTVENLSKKNIGRLEELVGSNLYKAEEGDTIFSHTIPPDDSFRYVYDKKDVPFFFNSGEHLNKSWFIGHLHCPFILSKEPFKKGDVIDLSKSKRTIISAPSVGQPRDGNWETGYLVYDSDDRVLEYHRIEYPVGKTQRKMLNAGLPPDLAKRLEFGQ